MVAQFLSLKLRLIGHSFRRSPWQLIGMIVTLVYGVGAGGLAIAGLVALRLAEPDLTRTLVVTLGSIVTLGFFVVPLAFGVDDTLDPRKFALYGIRTSRLATALAITALLGVPALVITAIAVAQTVTWSRGSASAILSMLGAVVIVATCVLGSRVTTSLASFFLATRRAREISGLVFLIVLVAVSPVMALLANVDWRRSGLAVMYQAADVAAWTPFGAAWAAPADAATGDLGGGILKLLLAVFYLGLLWMGWRALVAAMLVSRHRESKPRTYTGLGWFSRLPSSPTWAVAARSLTYWTRDARYRTQLVIVPIVPLLMLATFLIGGVYWQTLALLPLPVMALFLGWSVHNDVAQDNTAIWLHVSSNVSGLADRIGRLVPPLVIGVPLIAVGAPLSTLIYGDDTVLPSLVGVSTGILFAGLGLSSLFSAWFPYPTVRPGDSPFSQPQASGGSASVVQSVAFLATLGFTMPSLVFAWFGLRSGGEWPMISLMAGLGVGLAVLALGVSIGARIFDQRGPELLARALRN